MRGPPDSFSKPESVSPVAQNNASSMPRFEVSGASGDHGDRMDPQSLIDQYGWMINAEECDQEMWAELELEEQAREFFEKECQEEQGGYVYYNQRPGQGTPNNNRGPPRNTSRNNSTTPRNNPRNTSTRNSSAAANSVANAQSELDKLSLDTSANQTERLNPNATEFVPRSQRSQPK